MSSDIRLIVHKAAASLLLFYVDHPDARRRFRVMNDIEELERAQTALQAADLPCSKLADGAGAQVDAISLCATHFAKVWSFGRSR